eukprot:TRINITY_DN1349_c0_g2_i1.p1 TRINITY_DN1349_c0_g2~~TRINITY_DN1349_c0_g2_i1.p1  ORF type:complete len:612 (+),score=226.08 TRINITY_DN1349_c0_g2_i1:106-1836(+)
MESGTLVGWSKEVGDTVEAGDALADIETDKATLAFESTDDGFLAKQLVEAGTKDIAIGAPVGIVVEDAADIEAFANVTLADFSTDEAEAPVVSDPIAATPPPPTTSSEVAAEETSSPSAPQPDIVLSMPALSPTMESGKVLEWFAAVGDSLEVGDRIALIETDKASLDFEVTDEGYIAKLLVQEGDDVAVGSPIAILVENEAEIEQWKDYTVDMLAGGSGSAATPAATPAADASAPTPTDATTTTTTTTTPPKKATSGEKVVASPRAKMVAKEKDIDLSALSGSGPDGRIIAADVLEYVPPVVTETATKASSAAPSASSSAAPKGFSPQAVAANYHDIPNSNIRKITASRLTYSKQSVPHYYLTIEARVNSLMALRKELNDSAPKDKDGTPAFKLSVNDFIVKAAALALKKVPAVNSEWNDEFIREYSDVNINIAVNTPKGLLTPVINNADQVGLKTISNGIREKAARAVDGKATPADLAMGTFTISNLGMFGIKHFTAVINPPQAAILAVGTIDEVPVFTSETVTFEGEETRGVESASVLTVTLSCDHRVVDGAVGAEFLKVFKNLLENPTHLLL